jgi:hypothetical protein
MLDEVHVDEKWFFLCKDTQQSYILVSDKEEPPERYVKHKSHIEKVMFLCALARPRIVTGDNGNQRMLHGGKIGMWPIGEVKLAQRQSVNRAAGTPEWHNVNVDKDVYRELSEVVPAILNRWPDNNLDVRLLAKSQWL